VGRAPFHYIEHTFDGAPRRAGRIDCLEIEAKSVLNRVRGMPFGWSINPYRGCYHDCVFCYARRTHTFYERSGIGDWGTQLYVKVNAAAVLRRELASAALARRTRRDRNGHRSRTSRSKAATALRAACLAELARARTPAHLITRSPLVVRDIDVLQELTKAAGACVCVSLPTLDEGLARKIEPTVAPPRQRLRAVRMLAAAGLRVGVAVAPILPQLTDSKAALRAVFEAAAEAGAASAWHSVLNLNEVARESYFGFLRAEFPELVAGQETLYRRKYAPKAVVDAIELARRAGTPGRAPAAPRHDRRTTQARPTRAVRLRPGAKALMR
jgi:DNA repair photolyase